MTIKDKLGYAPLLILDGGKNENFNVSSDSKVDAHLENEQQFKQAVLDKLKLRAKSIGFTVLDISPENYDVPLSIRSNRANKAYYEYYKKNPRISKDKIAVYISIHYKSSDYNWGEAKGNIVIHYNQSDEYSRKLAEFVLGELVSGRVKMNKEIKGSNLQELKDAIMKAIRIEARFREVKEEEGWMLDDEFQDLMAKDILKGILKYYGLNEFATTNFNITDMKVRIEQLEQKVKRYEELFNKFNNVLNE